MPAIMLPTVSVGDIVKSFCHIKQNGEKETIYGTKFLQYTVTDFGLVGLTVSGNTKVLIPWNRILEVWF